MTPYADVLARLVTARRFGVVLGLDRMRSLLDALGAPDKRLGRVIHVGGTNGKGSTVALIAALARAAGLRVAAYTSPHLNELRERIAIDGAPIAYAAFVDAALRVSAAGGDELTFFEQVTAIACVAIAAANADVTILEVGLGGRLDATTAIAADVAVVTGVAMDHEAILGSTLAAIAGEKAGIFKRGQRIVIGASGEPAAVPTLIDAARAVDVEPVVVDDAAIAAVPAVALIGEHQRANAACALAAIDALASLAPPAVPASTDAPTWARLVDAKVRTRALSTVTHPGRFEIIREAAIAQTQLGTVILDGAHNPHGAASLARTLVARGIRPTLVIGVSADKDVHAMLAALLPAVGEVIATRYQQDRALEPTALAFAVFDLRGPDAPPTVIHVEPDLAHALHRATLVHPYSPILVAGSLFLVGEARALLLGVPTDPFVATDPPAR